MAFSYSALQTTSVTISGSVSTQTSPPVPTDSMTIVSAPFSNAANNATIYTVPAGKTFYCLGIDCGSSLAAVQNIKNDGTTVATFLSPTGGLSHLLTGGIIFIAQATKNITITIDAGAAYGTIWGYLL